mgnify:FL=1
MGKFLLIRWAEGSGGSFLSSVIAASPSVWHWDSAVQLNKSEDACLDYIKSRFQPDFDGWIARDPKPQNDYNLHFISTKYPRGDDLSEEEFSSLCEQEGSNHFRDGMDSGLLIPFPWHKINTPPFFSFAKSMTIRIDRLSLRWYHRSLWNKKFGMKGSLIHVKADDPSYNPGRQEYFLRFNNPYLIDQPLRKFVRENILLNKQKLAFLEPSVGNAMIDLSEMLDTDSFVSAVGRICKQLGIASPSKGFIKDSHQHWMYCHDR